MKSKRMNMVMICFVVSCLLAGSTAFAAMVTSNDRSPKIKMKLDAAYNVSRGAAHKVENKFDYKNLSAKLEECDGNCVVVMSILKVDKNKWKHPTSIAGIKRGLDNEKVLAFMSSTIKENRDQDWTTATLGGESDYERKFTVDFSDQPPVVYTADLIKTPEEISIVFGKNFDGKDLSCVVKLDSRKKKMGGQDVALAVVDLADYRYDCKRVDREWKCSAFNKEIMDRFHAELDDCAVKFSGKLFDKEVNKQRTQERFDKEISDAVKKPYKWADWKGRVFTLGDIVEGKWGYTQDSFEPVWRGYKPPFDTVATAAFGAYIWDTLLDLVNDNRVYDRDVLLSKHDILWDQIMQVEVDTTEAVDTGEASTATDAQS